MNKLKFLLLSLPVICLAACGNNTSTTSSSSSSSSSSSTTEEPTSSTTEDPAKPDSLMYACKYNDFYHNFLEQETKYNTVDIIGKINNKNISSYAIGYDTLNEKITISYTLEDSSFISGVAAGEEPDYILVAVNQFVARNKDKVEYILSNEKIEAIGYIGNEVAANITYSSSGYLERIKARVLDGGSSYVYYDLIFNNWRTE